MTTAAEVLPVVERADHVPGPPQGQWTYDDYAALPDDGNRYEIIDGVLYMTPAPNFGHQMSSMHFGSLLYQHVVVGGRGVVLAAPFDVDIGLGRSVVQPDVLVILNANRGILTPARAVGAPDLVIEISSPSTATHDRQRKFRAYARAGVPEYWIADPNAKTVEPHFLENGDYVSGGVFGGGAIIPSRVLPEFKVPVERFFA